MTIEEIGKGTIINGVPYFIGQKIKVKHDNYAGKQGELTKIDYDGQKNPDSAVFCIDLESGEPIKLGLRYLSSLKKTRAEWQASSTDNIDKYLFPGDIIDQELYEYFLNVLPPRHQRRGYLQLMTPYDDALNSDGLYHPVYMTFSSTDGHWYYLGHCFDNGYECQTLLFSKTFVIPIIESRHATKGVV